MGTFLIFASSSSGLIENEECPHFPAPCDYCRGKPAPHKREIPVGAGLKPARTDGPMFDSGFGPLREENWIFVHTPVQICRLRLW